MIADIIASWHNFIKYVVLGDSMFDKLKNYQQAKPSLWQGRNDAEKKERFFQNIRFIEDENELINAAPQTLFIGFACDTGVIRNQGRPGARLGPDSIKKQIAKLPCKNQSYIDLGTVSCPDDDLESAQRQLATVISYCHQKRHKTIVLGGGHEIAWAHYQGLAPHYHKLGIINFDAHFDLRPLEKNNKGTSGTPFSQIANFCYANERDFAYCCLGIQPMGNTASLFGAAQKTNTNYLTAEQIGTLSFDEKKIFIDNFIKGLDSIYLTICMDVFAECYAPGVSAPQTLGITPSQALPLLKYIVQTGKVVSLDVAELSPPLDQDEKTARLAGVIIGELLQIL